MASTQKTRVPTMPYVLEFARFLGGFVLIVGVALLLLRVISVTAAGTQMSPAAAARSAPAR